VLGRSFASGAEAKVLKKDLKKAKKAQLLQQQEEEQRFDATLFLWLSFSCYP
jgi:hypothetical protein